MRRIVEVAHISASTLYRKLEHVSAQCVAFATDFERHLPEKTFDHLNFASDRQDYLVNWGAHVNRRSFMIRAVATAETYSGYVLGIHPNFDPSHSLMALELAARENGDHEREPIDRIHPQYWLRGDYLAIAEINAQQREKEGTKTYHQRRKGIPVDPFNEPAEQTAPASGVQIRQEYILFAHFLYIQRLLQGVNRTSFFLDPDSGIRSAMLLAFQESIRAGTTQAFLIRSQKMLTVDQRKQLLANSETALRRFQDRSGETDKRQAGLMWLEAQFKTLLGSDDASAWMPHPFPDAAEPKKELSLLTATSRSDPQDLAKRALYGGLKSVDRFFMSTRRRISLLERPIATPASAKRMWYGYSPYNPIVACQLLDAFRVVYNYHLAGKDKKTPAMRLGLCDRVFSLEEILAIRRKTAAPTLRRTRTS